MFLINKLYYIFEEFNTLLQVGSVKEYQKKFKKLRPLVLLRNKGITDVKFLKWIEGGN